MNDDRTGQIAVIFVSIRNDTDAAGYGEAAAAMDALAATQPGYRGIDSAREVGGMGITVSYWADDAAAIAWRDHPEHTAIREYGRALWYDSYFVNVSRIERAYDWVRP
ncbi:antibiotic biosynthesis monooxygenase [Sphingomonas faeni]|uniref:antibiotic biosynthesis monooxygenase n=1 Tax=Sphingomonas faeni TaxID=185950 RepID=UPI00334C04D7